MGDATHDDRWDELALGHVLGGLPAGDASEFRGHLASCSQCRARVAELRSLASDMAAAEREERATQRIRTQTESRREPEAPPSPSPVSLGRRTVVAAAVVVLVLALLSIWNAHLRTQNGELRDAVDRQARTLVTLGAGTAVPATTATGVTGVVSVDGDRVGYSLAGLPVPQAGERLVVWLEADGEYTPSAVHVPTQLEDGRLASTLAAVDASRLLITIEPIVIPERPSERVVVEAELDVIPQDE